jgi:hypothetical protein
MLGPRRPWRGTLSSSALVPCALSLFVAAKFTLIWVFSNLSGYTPLQSRVYLHKL